MIEYMIIIYLVGAMVFSFASGIAFEMYNSLDHMRPKLFNRIIYHALAWPLSFMFLFGAVLYDAYKHFNPRGNF